MGVFEKILWSVLAEFVYSSPQLPWLPGETREGAKNSTGLGKRAIMFGIKGLRRDVGREEVCARQGQGKGSHGAVSVSKKSLSRFSSP